MVLPPEPFPPPPFEGFPAEAFTFLRALASHQDKAWFNDHKATYEQAVRAPLQSLVAEVSQRLHKAGLPLKGDPQKALFRINRDVRFSKDKRPYKTHAGAVLTRDGIKGSPGLLYIHVAADGCFAAAGFFRAEPPTLRKLRQHLVREPLAWGKVVRACAKSELSLEDGEPLVRLPKGFEGAPETLHTALKRNSWIVRRPLLPEVIATPRAADAIAAFAASAMPLLRFGWDALDQ